MNAPSAFGKRLAGLLACAALGVALALAGVFFAGSQWWYLAIPAVVAVGWLFVADPTQCDPPARPPNGTPDGTSRMCGTEQTSHEDCD